MLVRIRVGLFDVFENIEQEEQIPPSGSVRILG